MKQLTDAWKSLAAFFRHKHKFTRARKGQDQDKTHCRCGETRAIRHRKPKGATA